MIPLDQINIKTHHKVSLSHQGLNAASPLDMMNHAISNYHRLINSTAQSDEQYHVLLHDLGSTYLDRFEYSGHTGDLEMGLVYLKQAIPLFPLASVARDICLDSLGMAHRCYFQCKGDAADIEQAISAGRQAVSLTSEGDVHLPERLSNLGNSLACKFEHTGDPLDLNDAIDIQRRAISLTDERDPARAGRFGNLGGLLALRFQSTGDVVDIDDSVSSLSTAVTLTPNHPGLLSNLGNALSLRFGRLHQLADIDGAIFAQRQAAICTPDDNVYKAMWLSNLGVSLFNRFTYREIFTDLDQAVAAHARSVELTAQDHAEMPKRLNNLGNSLMRRFDRRQNPDDIHAAISAQKQAVALTSDGQAHMPSYLESLGISYLCRFLHTKNPDDVDEAIRLQEQAVDLIPDGHANKYTTLNSLGDSRLERFKQQNNEVDLDAAIEAYSASARSSVSAPTVVLRGARKWTECFLTRYGLPSFEACKIIVETIPRIVWLGTEISQRYSDIPSLGDAANQAVAAAIQLEKYETAVEWMEQGRSIVWSQLLHLRTPLDDLEASSPDLARELRDISQKLEALGNEQQSASPDSQGTRSMENEAQTHRRLAERYEQLLHNIRELPTFEDFLLPKKLPDLRVLSTMSCGPIVMLNIYHETCDALVLMQPNTPIFRIRLPEFTYMTAKRLHKTLLVGLAQEGIRIDRDSTDRASMAYISSKSGITDPMQHVLETLWVQVVDPVLSGMPNLVRQYFFIGPFVFY